MWPEASIGPKGFAAMPLSRARVMVVDLGFGDAGKGTLTQCLRAWASPTRSIGSTSAKCLVTAPVHQAAICIRELARGDARHGSCGVGVGETMRDAIAATEDALRAGDPLGRALLHARPSYREVSAGRSHGPVTSAVEEALGSDVVVTSSGPTWADKAVRGDWLARAKTSR